MEIETELSNAKYERLQAAIVGKYNIQDVREGRCKYSIEDMQGGSKGPKGRRPATGGPASARGSDVSQVACQWTHGMTA